MIQKGTIGVVFRGFESEVGFYAPPDNSFYLDLDTPCISARVRRTGMENPRFRLEAPEIWMTLDTRQRQLHDEDKSCGIQPAHIRMIYRRPKFLCPDQNMRLKKE
jgi:hypothetical protein